MTVVSISNLFAIASCDGPLSDAIEADALIGMEMMTQTSSFVPECRWWAGPLIMLVMQMCAGLRGGKKKADRKKKLPTPTGLYCNDSRHTFELL